MNDTATTLVVIALAVAMILVAYDLLEATRPQYRKGCNECGAARRRDEERQAELRHDAQHRGFKAVGLPAPTEDRWPCDDKACPRNDRLRR